MHVTAWEENNVTLFNLRNNIFSITIKWIWWKVKELGCLMFFRIKLNVLTSRDVTITMSVGTMDRVAVVVLTPDAPFLKVIYLSSRSTIIDPRSSGITASRIGCILLYQCQPQGGRPSRGGPQACHNQNHNHL